jgi:hypothetical protein
VHRSSPMLSPRLFLLAGWYQRFLPKQKRLYLLLRLGARYKLCFSTNQIGAAERVLYIYNRLSNCQASVYLDHHIATPGPRFVFS